MDAWRDVSLTRVRRWTLAGIAALALIALLAGGWALSSLVSIAVAYKAKMICSAMYVAGRSLPEAAEDLHIDDLEQLRRVRVEVDSAAQLVTARFAGVFTRSAGHLPGQGCALDRRPRSPAHGSTPPRAVNAASEDKATPDVAAVLPSLQAALDDAFAETTGRVPRRTNAIVILRDGGLIAERYRSGIDASTPLPGWSMTKSVMNALVGTLVKHGLLSLDQPASIPAWLGASDPRRHITIDHLLRMSSGLKFDEGMSSPRSDVMRMLFGNAGVAEYSVSRPLEAEPGTRWQYASANTNILSALIRAAVDGDYHAYPRRALFAPLGMESAILETDSHGTFVGSSYMYATARDWAKFGQLYLADGVWGGRRILPAGWVLYSTTPAPADSTQQYGAHFWRKVPAEYRRGQDRLPADAFHAVGHEGQFVTVIPSAGVVIVRLGRTRHPDGWDHVHFVELVLAALSSS
jgi:CubicO group peptidase (beta-lactamase class C family)